VLNPALVTLAGVVTEYDGTGAVDVRVTCLVADCKSVPLVYTENVTLYVDDTEPLRAELEMVTLVLPAP
jgi:hypothetical protein